MATYSQRMTDEKARYGADAARPMFLLKLPSSVSSAWSSSFDDGDTVLARCDTSSLADGSFLHLPGGLTLRLKLNPVPDTATKKQRIISCYPDEKGSDVKFEGLVQWTGLLMPVSATDPQYLARVRAGHEALDVRETLVGTMGHKQEIETLKKSVVIRPMAEVKESDDEEEEEESDEEEDAAAASKKKVKKGPKSKKEKPKYSGQEVKDRLIHFFTEMRKAGKVNIKHKDIRKGTKLQLHVYNPVLLEICVEHEKDKTVSLKEQYFKKS